MNNCLIFGTGKERGDLFQAKFLPFSDDRKIVSCARDGQVRLAELHANGEPRLTRNLAQHAASAHKVFSCLFIDCFVLQFKSFHRFS